MLASMASVDAPIGRDEELSLLEGCFEDARAGRGTCVLVRGEAGIGKSRLVAHAARRASALGLDVAWGVAWDGSETPPFGLFREALRALRRARGGAGDHPALARLLPEIGAPLPSFGADADRLVLTDAVLDYLGAACAERPCCLVLEDLHAADDESLRLLETLVARMAQLPLCAVVTARDRDARARVSEERIARLGGRARTIALGPLGSDAVFALATAAAPGTTPDVARAIERITGGHPLYVVETLASLARAMRGKAASEWRAEDVRVPPSVHAAIRAHLATVPAEIRPLLEIVAAFGRDVSVAHVSAALGISPKAALDVLTRATTAGLLVERRPDRFGLLHDLVRETIAIDLDATRRAEVHAKVAAALATLHANDPEPPLLELAHHRLEAGAPALDDAIAIVLRAARRAAIDLSFTEVERLVVRAREALESRRPGDAPTRTDLDLALAEIRIGAGRADDGQGLAASAAAAAATDPERLARAALVYGRVFRFGTVDPRLVELLERALAALPGGAHALRARVMARLAGALQPAPDPNVPIAIARDAIALARESADERTQLEVLNAAMSALMDYADPEERKPYNEDQVRLATKLGEPLLALRGRSRLVFDELERGDARAWDAAMKRYEDEAARFPHAPVRFQATMLRAMRALVTGAFEEHARLLEEARTLGERAGDAFAAQVVRFHTLGALRIADRTDELRARLDEMVAAVAPYAHYPAVTRAMIHARAGEPELARGALERLDRAAAARTMDATVGLYLAEIAYALGDHDAAEHALALLEPIPYDAASWTAAGYIVEGPGRAQYLALATLGRRDEARAWSDVALDWARRTGARPAEARIERERQTVLGRSAKRPVSGAPPATQTASCARDGETWIVTFGDATVRARDSRGLQMLARLLDAPGRDIHAVELDRGPDAARDARTAPPASDAGEHLDARALAAYRARLRALDEELEEAAAWNDAARRTKLESERDALAREISRAVGLGGRPRRARSDAERARVNVQRRLADAIKRVANVDARLGRHLEATIVTGTFCSYAPERDRGE